MIVSYSFYGTIILVSLFIALINYFWRNVYFWSNRGIKGPKPIPFFGNLIDNFRTPINILEIQRSKQYGKIYGYMELTKPVLSVSDIELIKLITMKDFHCFPNHQNLTPGDALLSKLLINMVDDEWKRVRNICIPAFTTLRIKQMCPMINKNVDNTLFYFDGLAATHQQIELKKTFTSFASDVVASTVFGVQVNSFDNPDGEYSRYAYNMTDLGRLRVLIGFLMPGKLRQLLGFSIFSPSSIDYFKKLVKHIIHERRGMDTKHKDLVKLLLNAEMNDIKQLTNLNEEGFSNSELLHLKHSKRMLDDDEILAQSLMMIIAGIETTSTALMFFVYTLAMRTDIQNKIYKEVKHCIENKKYDYDSLMSLPYLDAVMNEVLRYYSPVVQLDRVANCDYELGDTGITIPKGTVINIPFHAINNDPDYWQQPFEFRPERFLPENKSEIIPYSFASFGFGPRICLGMKLAVAEIKAMIAKLVYQFEVIRTHKTPAEPKYNGKKFNIHCEPIFVALKRRVH